jgi:hypothetical protein
MVIELSQIPEEKRLSELEFKNAFRDALPGLRSAFFELLSKALNIYYNDRPKIPLKRPHVIMAIHSPFLIRDKHMSLMAKTALGTCILTRQKLTRTATSLNIPAFSAATNALFS